MILEAKNISKKFSGDIIISDFSDTFHPGELVAIKGTSGSGKTTLLSIISTLMRPTSGKLFFNDVDITSFDDNRIAKFRNSHFGFVFQSANMINHLKVWENVVLPFYYGNYRTLDEMKSIAKACLELVNLGELFDRSVTTLSGGEQQRVAIARSVINDPNIIFADEPTGSLDSNNTIVVMDFLRSLCLKNKTVIIVTHDEEIAKQADRTISISKYDNKV